MKIFMAVVFFAFFLLAASNLDAQNMTIILLRHAEKDISATANKADPDLTEAGRERAARLVEVVKKYKPEQIFSTVFKRARFTGVPLAEQLDPRYRVQIQAYDSDYLDDFAEKLLKLKAKCVIVIGHNTTTPMLANALIKQENKYKFLDDSEYNKIWIIKIKGKKITDEVIEY
jgi:2,3-bisphosphoglycerate-dependent phosphoglycerate mutase